MKGVPAVVAVVLFVAVSVGYRIFLRSDLPGDPEVRRQLELNLQSEIAGDIMKDSDAIQRAIESGDKTQATQLAKGVTQRRVDIGELAMKGTGDDIVLRATYTVQGPDGPETKTGYFSYSHSAITGWRYHRQTTPVSWYLKLF